MAKIKYIKGRQVFDSRGNPTVEAEVFSDLGSAFGGGSSDSLFGPLGPSNFFSKLTWGLITVFFVLCLLLAYLSKQELTLNVSEDLIEETFDEPPVE